MKLLTIIFFILATSISINAVERNDTTSYRNIVHKKKYRSIRENLEDAVLYGKDNKIYVVTYLERLIWHHKVKKEHATQSSFDAFSMLNLNNFFPFPGSFYDTIAVQTDKFNLKWIEENRANAKTEIGWLQSMLESGSALKLERKKFWKEYLAICKKHLSRESYYETANAIYEFHDSVGISFEDSICVFADTYHNLEKIIRDNIYFSDSIILENAKTEFFEQYSNDTRNNLTWEEQLEYAMDFSKQQKGVKSPIKLKGYKEKGYSYAVYCGAHFDEDGILTDYQIFQRSYSDDFHDCKTDVRTIEGDKGTSPLYKFFYIMGYGRMPISIVWSEEKGAQVSVAEYYDKGERTLKPQWW